MNRNFFKKFLPLLIVFSLVAGNLVVAQRRMKPESEDIMPTFGFIGLNEGVQIKGEIEIKGKVKDANSVEFYYQIPGAPLPVYLGKGEPKGENIWKYSWNTYLTPNGDYQIFAKITNPFGEYESERLNIKIENEVPREEEKEMELMDEFERISEEIERTEREIKEEEEMARQKIRERVTPETEKEVKERVGKLIEKVKEITQMENEMKEVEEEKKLRESWIKTAEEELSEIRSIPEPYKEKIKPIEEEKERGLEVEKIEMQKSAEKIESLKKELEKEVKEKEEIKKEVIEKVEETEREEMATQLEDLEKKVKEKEEMKIDMRKVLIKDSDGDALSDEEEIRLGTNLFNPDSDGDSFLDGIEIQTGYDPLKAGPADKIIYQNPQKVPPKKATIYKIERVEKVVLPTGEMGLKFSGRGLPNSFVTIYIFSKPIVVAVKTDYNGYWEYALDKPLTDGEHRVYATLTNNRGEVVARSEAFIFTKAGEKIFRIFELPTETISPVQTLQKPFIILILILIILALVIALIIIGLSDKEGVRKE